MSFPLFFQKRNWSVFIYRIFAELIDAKTFMMKPGSVEFMQWLMNEGGYVCDCKPGYLWVDTQRHCVLSVYSKRISSCANVTHPNPLGKCDPEGTRSCMTNM